MPIDQITSASLASGVPTRAQLPSGSVLQVQVLQWSTQSKRDGTFHDYIDAPGSSLAITTSVPNSRILVQIQVQIYSGSAGVSANIGLRRGSTRLAGIDGTGTGNSWAGHGNGYQGSQRMALDFLDSPNVAAGTTLTYVVMHGHWSGGTTWFNYSESTYTNFSTITLMEIAA
jgi:hypothetical protein